MATKICSTCNKEKPHDHFTRDKSKKDGRKSRCRKCQRKWNDSNREKKLEQQRRYAAKPENRYKKYKRSAEARGFDFKLTFEQFMKWWKKPCVHCGSPIETIGLDRIDSKKPYEIGNVEPCCSKCNQMKSDWNSIAWYEHMERIRKHQRGFLSAIRRLWK